MDQANSTKRITRFSLTKQEQFSNKQVLMLKGGTILRKINTPRGVFLTSSTKKVLNNNPVSPIVVKDSNKNAYCRCSEVLKAMQVNQETNKTMLQRLTDEIFDLRKELRDERTMTDQLAFTHPPILPRTPFEKVEEFLNFNQEVQDSPDKFNELKMAFMFCGRDKEPKKFIKTSLTRIIHDKVAVEFSWRGTQSKRCAKTLSTLAALKDAFQSCHDQTEEYFDQTAMRHFQYANDRLGSKKKP